MPTSAAETRWPDGAAATASGVAPSISTTRTALLLFAALVVAAALRFDQFAALVVIDDEWHAIHRLMFWTPGRMFVDFNIADYSIPIGLAYWGIANTVGLSEVWMRLPMLVAGLALVATLPWALRHRMGPGVVFAFALLLAASPMLVIYSQTARPYAITLLLGWIAHGAFQHYWNGSDRAGFAYAACATLAAWLHPVIGPFVVAPFLWGLWQIRSQPSGARAQPFRRLCVLAAGTALPMLALLLPPTLTRPAALGEKSGFTLPTADTLIGTVYWWLGTSSLAVMVATVALAAAGAVALWRTLPEVRTGLLGIGLTLVPLLVARPQYLEHSATLGRYLLPALPLVLLAVATGSVTLARRLGRAVRWGRRPLVVLSTLLPAAALAATSPLPVWLVRPTSYRLALHFHFDFRPRDAGAPPSYLEQIPLSPYWQQLGRAPRGSYLIAAAPFYFESYYWDAHRWEKLSRQRVIPGFLTGLCVDSRFGEVPRDQKFRFANAVHLADAGALARAGVDYIAWQKPYRHPSNLVAQPLSADTAHCEPVLKSRFPVVYEDDHLVVFRAQASGQR